MRVHNRDITAHNSAAHERHNDPYTRPGPGGLPEPRFGSDRRHRGRGRDWGFEPRFDLDADPGSERRRRTYWERLERTGTPPP